MVSPQPRREPQVHPFVLRFSKGERTVAAERGFVVREPVLSLSKEPHHERGGTLASPAPMRERS